MLGGGPTMKQPKSAAMPRILSVGLSRMVWMHFSKPPGVKITKRRLISLDMFRQLCRDPPWNGTAGTGRSVEHPIFDQDPNRSLFAPALGGSDGQAERLQSVFRPRGRGASLSQRRKESLQLQSVTRLKTVGEIFVMIVAPREI